MVSRIGGAGPASPSDESPQVAADLKGQLQRYIELCEPPIDLDHLAKATVRLAQMAMRAQSC